MAKSCNIVLKESSEQGSDTTIHIYRIKEDVRNAFSEGKITELHYNLLNETIAELTSKNDTRK
jgi:hypothetical protein